MNTLKKAALIVALVIIMAGAATAFQMNEAAAQAYRAQQSEEPVVLGHRIGPAGQEMLIIK